MDRAAQAIHLQLQREIVHWSAATSRLKDLDNFASADAWKRLEHEMGIAVRRRLLAATHRLQKQAEAVRIEFHSAQSGRQLWHVQQLLVRLRHQYLRTETTLEFYADAINTRSSPDMAELLRACDILAQRAMASVLGPLGMTTPHVLTYVKKGLGASILRAELRLWDGGTLSPAAAIKVVRHNLFRPTSLIHEAGHQVAHMTGWNEELAGALEDGLSDAGAGVSGVWASWASEITADSLSFAHAGYASVAALHDVLSGNDAFVFRYLAHDPHPLTYLRVLLGVAMCRRFYGDGPWDLLALAWQTRHPLQRASANLRALIQRSLPRLQVIVEQCLLRPMRAFGGRPLAALVSPENVRPAELRELQQLAGPALFTSPHWIQTENIRLLALLGYQIATHPEKAAELLKTQEAWMRRLGQFAAAPQRMTLKSLNAV